MDLPATKNYILGRLEKGLHKNLFYHQIEHTLDVYHAALRLIDMENTDRHSGMLIETAALFHDAGMITTYRKHEFASAEMVRDVLPGFGYSGEDIEEIVAMIMMTQMPQAAITPNQMILCDADLDALGREDFFIASLQLQLEWKIYGIMDTTISEWILYEIDFMEKHSYYTSSARKLRNLQKDRNLIELKSLIDR